MLGKEEIPDFDHPIYTWECGIRAICAKLLLKQTFRKKNLCQPLKFRKNYQTCIKFSMPKYFFFA